MPIECLWYLVFVQQGSETFIKLGLSRFNLRLYYYFPFYSHSSCPPPPLTVMYSSAIFYYPVSIYVLNLSMDIVRLDQDKSMTEGKNVVSVHGQKDTPCGLSNWLPVCNEQGPPEYHYQKNIQQDFRYHQVVLD